MSGHATVWGVPDVYEWPDDEIVDAPAAAPAPGTFPPPMAPMPTRPVTLPPTPKPLLPPIAPPPPHAPLPPAPKRSGAMPLIVMGTVAAAAVAVIAVAVVASGKDSPKPPADAGGTPLASIPVAAPASGPVTDIALADNGDNAVITWAYPFGANGPIIVSAALAGEPMRAMQSLPAGTQTYTLVNLDPQRDYCVTVTIAYTAENTVMAPPVCTKRKQ